MSRPFPTPALDAWRAELREGKRDTVTFDALWKAASAEAWALDYSAYPEIAEKFREDARRIVREALKGPAG